MYWVYNQCIPWQLSISHDLSSGKWRIPLHGYKRFLKIESNWLTRHDNAPTHTIFKTHEFCYRSSLLTPSIRRAWPHAASSFSQRWQTLKLKSCRFDTVDEIQCESQEMLDTLHETDWQRTIQQFQRCWEQYIPEQGTNLKVIMTKTPRVFVSEIFCHLIQQFLFCVSNVQQSSKHIFLNIQYLLFYGQIPR